MKSDIPNSLLKLLNDKEISYSSLSKKYIEELLELKIIFIKRLSIRNKKIVLLNEKGLENFIDNLLKFKQTTTRSDLENTKDKKIEVKKGVFVNGIFRLKNGFRLDIPLENSALFLKDIDLIIENTTIVITENFENITHKNFVKQLKLFNLTDEVLFIYRGNTKAEKELLYKLLEKKYKFYYFGDYDLAGISIFINEFYKRNNNIQFLIPKNIENLFEEYGTQTLYKKQFNKYKNLTTNLTYLNDLIYLIHSTQKTIEQERLFKNK